MTFFTWIWRHGDCIKIIGGRRRVEKLSTRSQSTLQLRSLFVSTLMWSWHQSLGRASRTPFSSKITSYWYCVKSCHRDDLRWIFWLLLFGSICYKVIGNPVSSTHTKRADVLRWILLVYLLTCAPKREDKMDTKLYTSSNLSGKNC